MTVVDSSGWLEYFADGPNAKHFAPAVVDPAQLVVPTVILYEVVKVVLRDAGEHAALHACAALRKGTVVDFTGELAISAAKLGLQHALSLADAIILATARAHDATLWTQDAHFKDLPGVRFFPKR